MQNTVLVPFAEHKTENNAVGSLHYIRETYLDMLERYDLAPLFVTHTMSEETISDFWSHADGLLTMGGLDIKPEFYTNEPAHAQSNPSGARDALELQLVRQAINSRLPTLGICRGCQVLAVASGGSLDQHVPESTEETHDIPSDGLTYDPIADVEHEITIAADSRLADIVGSESITVNSGHHQAVQDPGSDLSVAARSPDGVVEAVEHTDSEYFCFGIQSHPELDAGGDLEPVFAAFAQAVRKR